MMQELSRLRELTDSITSNGYLKDQAEEWGYAFDAIPDYIYIINTRSKLKFINKPLAEKLDIDPSGSLDNICIDDLIGLDFSCGGNAKDLTAEFKKSNVYINGLNGYFNISRTPIYTHAYKIIGFICVLQPISKCNFIFEEVDTFLKPILDVIPCGMCVINMVNNKIKYVNTIFEELLEHTKKDLIDADINLLFKDEKESKLLNNNTKVIEIPNSDYYLLIIDPQIS